jgi:anti-anti-sigma factor
VTARWARGAPEGSSRETGSAWHREADLSAVGSMGKNVFSCRNYAKKGHSVVEITGDLTFETVDVMRQEFANLRLQRPEKVILDCTGVTMLSSVGLGEFSKLIKWGLDNNCQFKIVCQSGHVVEVLEIAGITDMIPLLPTIDIALNR